jgi:hypothetical protein
MKSKEIQKEGSKRRVNTATDPSKKVYLTPGEFIWDNYKRGEKMKEDNIKKWKDIETRQMTALEEINPEAFMNEEAKITKRQLKTILKNFNNVAKGIRNINRALKESL